MVSRFVLLSVIAAFAAGCGSSGDFGDDDALAAFTDVSEGSNPYVETNAAAEGGKW